MKAIVVISLIYTMTQYNRSISIEIILSRKGFDLSVLLDDIL